MAAVKNAEDKTTMKSFIPTSCCNETIIRRESALCNRFAIRKAKKGV